MFLRNAWYAAAHAEELDNGLVSRTICNEPIVIFRTSSGAVAALEDRCPHRFVPLSMGKQVGDSLQCGYHGLSFDATGACSEAPNDKQKKESICVRAYNIVERYAVLWLWMGASQDADASKIPDFSFLSDVENYAVARGCSYIKANYQLLSDNLLDLSHVHYLHSDIQHGTEFSEFTNKLKIENDTIWSMLWRHRLPFDDKRQKSLGFETGDVEGQAHSRLDLPGNILVDTAFWERGKSKQEGVSNPSAHLLTPETETSTHYFWASGRSNDITNEEHTRFMQGMMAKIIETEDGAMCEAQQRALGGSTDFLAAQPMILRADAAGVAARRIAKRRLKNEVRKPGPDSRTKSDLDDDRAAFA